MKSRAEIKNNNIVIIADHRQESVSNNAMSLLPCITHEQHLNSKKRSRKCCNTQHITLVLTILLCLLYYPIHQMATNLTNAYESVTAISEETPVAVKSRSVMNLTVAAKEEVATPLPNFQCLKRFQFELNKIQNLAKNSSIPMLGTIVPTQNGVEVIFIMTHLPKQKYKRWYEESWYCSSSTPAVMRGIDPRSHTLTIECPSSTQSIKVGNNVAQYFIPSNTCPWKFKPARVSACTMVKGSEAKSQLPAWIAYHHLIGIEQFYIYLNDDEEKDEPPFHHENVHWIPFQDTLNKKFLLQRAMQNDCIARARNQSDWVALYDVDEFFQLMDGSTDVSTILQPYYGKRIGGISIKNVFFGHHPEEVVGKGLEKNTSVLEKFVWRVPSPCKGAVREKMIVQPNRVKYFSVHKITMGGPMKRMNAKSQIRMNHYKLASEGVYNPPKHKSCHVEKFALVHDDSMHVYVEQVRSELDIMMRGASSSHSLL